MNAYILVTVASQTVNHTMINYAISSLSFLNMKT